MRLEGAFLLAPLRALEEMISNLTCLLYYAKQVLRKYTYPCGRYQLYAFFRCNIAFPFKIISNYDTSTTTRRSGVNIQLHFPPYIQGSFFVSGENTSAGITGNTLFICNKAFVF